MPRLALDRFVDAAVAEVRGAVQRVHRRFSAQQLAAQGACKHVARAVQRQLDKGPQHEADAAVQPREIADAGLGADAGENGVFDLLRVEKRLVRAGAGEAREQRRLRPVGRDHVRQTAQLPHGVDMRVGKAAIEPSVVAQHWVDHDERPPVCEAADELRREPDLLRRAAVAGGDAVKLHADLLPVRGKRAHGFGRVLHDVAGEAARVRREKGRRQRDGLDPVAGQDRHRDAQRALAEAGQVVNERGPLQAAGVDCLHAWLRFWICLPTIPAARLMSRVRIIRMAAMAKATSNSPSSLA